MMRTEITTTFYAYRGGAFSGRAEILVTHASMALPPPYDAIASSAMISRY